MAHRGLKPTASRALGGDRGKSASRTADGERNAFRNTEQPAKRALQGRHWRSACRGIHAAGRRPDTARIGRIAVTALILSACSYDLDRLRGTHDAGQEIESPDVATDMAIDDTPFDTVNDTPDVIVPDVPMDVPVEAGPVCTTRSAPSVPDVGTRVGGTYRVTGDTTGEPSMLSPPNTSECSFGSSTAPAPERVYRYTVQTGPRLYANTDAADCAGAFDTVLYARTSCDPGVGSDLDCDDDDRVLSNCGGHAALASGILLDGLNAGDVVFLVIDGYNGNSGPFRLNVTENGLFNAQPSSDFALNPADACMCPGSLDNMQRTVMFPDSTDRMRNSTGSTVTALNRAGDRLTGTHTVTFTHIAGAALEFRLNSNGLCAGASAAIDLLIGGQAIGAFYIDAGARPGSTQRMALQTFGTVTTTASSTVELRLRGITPPTCVSAAGITFDTSMPGTLTLLGRP